MMWTLPLATTTSIDTLAPTSIEASSISTPSGPTVMPKKPPPPSSDTVIRNGCSRSQKANRNRRGLGGKNGSVSAALRLMFSMLNTPTPMLGMGSE